jgi:hypothetical protein
MAQAAVIDAGGRPGSETDVGIRANVLTFLGVWVEAIWK